MSALDVRAAEAERSVASIFGGRLLRLPLTHLARVSHPPAKVTGPWHYWWQAHYLDAIVDAGLRAVRSRDIADARQRARLGNRLLGTIRWRNLGRFTNAYYDDMAWLALAVGRLDALGVVVGWEDRHRRRSAADRALAGRLESAMTPDLGGGLFWNTTRDFKNVPATAPYALYLARTGRPARARELVDWVYERLFDADSGLVLDGIRVTDGRQQLVADVWTYNQGTLLGALVTLGDEQSMARAAGLVAAVGSRLTTDDRDRQVLTTHGGGDGGLFTGILVRYLALAVTHTGLDDSARAAARQLVLDTAEAFWAERDERRLAGRPVCVFSPDAARPARVAQPAGGAVELSTQLQAWMTLEAAATLVALDR